MTQAPRGSIPPRPTKATTQKVVAFSFSRKVGFPFRETLGEGEKLACDGNLYPTLILFPKIAFWGICVL